ncbi:MAG: hypothetical protein CMC97_06830, partial [Flavobacteriales bacterium]|nr:hypothetical protein [Flavobacteriales bacterium]
MVHHRESRPIQAEAMHAAKHPLYDWRKIWKHQLDESIGIALSNVPDGVEGVDARAKRRFLAMMSDVEQHVDLHAKGVELHVLADIAVVVEMCVLVEGELLATTCPQGVGTIRSCGAFPCGRMKQRLVGVRVHGVIVRFL